MKRSVTIAGHRTSISLEDPFWQALKAAARDRRQTVSDLIDHIDAGRGEDGLSSAVRIWLLDYYRNRADGAG